MTTFTNWVQNTYSMIRHLPHGQKYDLKRAQAPVVRGFSPKPAAQPYRSPSSDIRLHSLKNRTLHECIDARTAATNAAPPRTASRVMTSPSAVSNPGLGDNRSWLHTHWKPGQVRAGIDFFERQGAASAQSTAVSRHGKTKRTPLPPQPVSVQAKTPTVPRGPESSKPTLLPPAQTTVQSPVMKQVTTPTKSFTPPPAPPADGLKLLQRADSEPTLSRPDMSALFAELRDHKLVRSDSAPATMGTACETDSAGSGQQTSMKSKVPREKPQRDAFQLELMKQMTPAKEAKAIKVKPEVKAQAEALRARLEAERNAAQSVSPRRSVDSNLPKVQAQRTYLPNGRFVPNTEQRSLVDELKHVQEARMLRATVAQGG